MTKILLVSTLLVALTLALAPSSAQADVGSCYSVKPICIGTQPVCMCDAKLNCFWACR